VDKRLRSNYAVECNPVEYNHRIRNDTRIAARENRARSPIEHVEFPKIIQVHF